MLSACQSADHDAPAAAPDAGSSDKPAIKSLAQPDAGRDGGVLNAAPVFGGAAQNHYGSIAVAGAAGARVCVLKAGTAPGCADLTRCAPVEGGAARLDYLESGTHQVFVCDAENAPGALHEAVVTGGEVAPLDLQ